MQKEFLLLKISRGFEGSRVRGFEGSRVRGFEGSRVRGFEGNVLKPPLTVSTHNGSVKAAKLLLWR
jgi:hypothetical protein